MTNATFYVVNILNRIKFVLSTSINSHFPWESRLSQKVSTTAKKKPVIRSCARFSKQIYNSVCHENQSRESIINIFVLTLR